MGIKKKRKQTRVLFVNARGAFFLPNLSTSRHLAVIRVRGNNCITTTFNSESADTVDNASSPLQEKMRCCDRKQGA